MEHLTSVFLLNWAPELFKFLGAFESVEAPPTMKSSFPEHFAVVVEPILEEE